jgi:hypothetical protein
VKEFEEICECVKPLWEETIERKKKRHGRTSQLKTFEDKLLALCIYYRTYIAHEFIGYLFGLHNTNICRLFKKLEPLVAKKFTIKKDRTLTQEEVLKLLADVTEQPTQRPSKKKKNMQTYSGKKKRHTLKEEIIIQDNGKIISTPHSYEGCAHDFKIRKQEKPMPRGAKKYVDLGYQGLQKRTSNRASAENLLILNRNHWAIENQLHRVRDMTFNEDRSTLRKGSPATHGFPAQYRYPSHQTS